MMKNFSFYKNTLLLTFTGLFTRILGFYYKIFLAKEIGAEGVGIYQLIFPLYGICFSLCASGIETAISKLTSEKYASGHEGEASNILRTALILTMTLAITCSFILYRNSESIAAVFLKEPRCAVLIRILAFTIPLGTCQSCICGHYFGRHRAFVPSAAQIIEQGIRILSTVFLCHIYLVNQLPLSPAIAVLGLVFGELASLLFTFTCFTFQNSVTKADSLFLKHLKEIYTLAAPLTLSRICVNLLISLESALLPLSLRSYGLSASESLKVYGIFTGMALPVILFPNAFTGSLALMLLPKVSELQICGNQIRLWNSIKNSCLLCLFLGIFCLLFFLIFGEFLGNLIFPDTSVGKLLKLLAWLCPFLYLNTTLGSILNGLGKTQVTFFNGTASLFLRILLVIVLVPRIGISGYLTGLVISQLFTTFSSVYFLKKQLSHT